MTFPHPTTIPLHEYFPDCVLPDCEISLKEPTKIHQHILPHQQHMLDNSTDFLYVQGGVGSAKSVALAVKAVRLSIEIPENRGVVGRRDFAHLYESMWRDIKVVNKRLVTKGYIEKPEYSRKVQGDHTHIQYSNDSEMRAIQCKNWSEGLGASYGWFLIDDAMETSEVLFSGDDTNAGLISRLRLPHIRYHRLSNGKIVNKLHGMIISQPPPVNHWLHKIFGRKEGIYEGDIGTYEHMVVGTHQNPFVDPSTYATRLIGVQKRMGNNQRVAKRIIFGESVPAYGGVPVIPRFDHRYHVGEFEFDKDLPLVRGWDFGYRHPAVVYFQIKRCNFFRNHVIVLSEVADMFNCYILDFYDEKVKPHDDQNYKEATLRMDGGDIAGLKSSDTNKDKRGPIKILRAPKHQGGRGIYIKSRRLSLQPSLDYMRGLFSLNDEDMCGCGEPDIVIHRECEGLIGACEGGYKLPKNKTTGLVGEKPFEDGFFADIFCALRYGAENFVKQWRPHKDVMAPTRRKKLQRPWDWMELSDEEIGAMLVEGVESS